MKKTIIGLLVCVFLLLLSPMTLGVGIHQTSEVKVMVNEWTILIGIISRPHRDTVNGIKIVEFNAFLVHYRMHWYGNIRAGWFHHFDRILLPQLHYGYLGFHFICAKFFVSLIH